MLGIVAGERAGPAPAAVVCSLSAWSRSDRHGSSTGGRGSRWPSSPSPCSAAPKPSARSNGQAHSPLTAAVARRAPETFSGVLVDDPQSGRFDTDAYVRVAAGGTHRTLFAVATGDDALRLRVLEAGDRVVIEGRLGPLRPNRFDGRARWRHAVGRLDRVQLLALSPASGALRLANGLREVVLRGTEPLPPHTACVARRVPARRHPGRPRRRRARLPQLRPFAPPRGVRRERRVHARALRTVAAPPRPRAAHDRGHRDRVAVRDDDTLRAVGAAGLRAVDRRVGIVVRRPARVEHSRTCARDRSRSCSLDPFLLHSVGFWLSCGASAGIAMLSSPLRERLPGPTWLRSPLAVSLAAQAGVTPVLLATFGSVPVVTPVANLLAAPAAEAVGVYGMLASAVGGLVPPLAPVLEAAVGGAPRVGHRGRAPWCRRRAHGRPSHGVVAPGRHVRGRGGDRARAAKPAR